MITGEPVAVVATVPDPAPGDRLRRRQRRRRLVREELLALAFLLAMLAVTVAVLASQWLGSAPYPGGTS